MLDNRFHHLVVIAIDALRTSPALLLENNVLFPRAARLRGWRPSSKIAL